MKELVLVTGSKGRIGSRVVERLKQQYDVIGVDREEIDLGSDESVWDVISKLPKKKIASVIHLAAYYSFDEQHSPLYDAVTVQGTRRLLEALQGRDVDQFLFSSTMLVHKPGEVGKPITEEWPIAPNWDYPLSKVKTERIIHEMRGDVKSVILRIAGIYDDQCHSIPISHQIQRIYENSFEARLFSGDINHGAAFLHMDDLIEAICLCVEKRAVLPGETVLLLGEEKTLSYDELQREISKLLRGKEITTYRVPKPIAQVGAFLQGLVMKTFIKPWMIALADDHYELNCSRAKKLLGWKPRHSLEGTLPRMIHALKQDPDAWYKLNLLT
jgi:nucleoside-diphosphate-sugar epimerase